MSKSPKFKIVDEETWNSGKLDDGGEDLTYITVKTAGTGLRLANSMVDGIIFYFVFISVNYFMFSLKYDHDVAYSLSQTNKDGGFFISALVNVICYTLCESLTQRTPGKYFTKTIVINEYGEKPDLANILGRSIIRLVPFDALSFLSGGRGWHDKWSKTFVVTQSEMDEIKILMDVDTIGSPEKQGEETEEES